MLPQSALDHDRLQSKVTEVATKGALQAWRRMGGNWERAWRNDVGPAVQAVVLEAQATSAATTDTYVASALAELGLQVDAPTSLNVDAFVGIAGDGRPVESLTFGAVIQAAKAQYRPDLAALPKAQATARALQEAGTWLEGVVASVMADTVRAAETTATAQRETITGYVRMVSPGACSRCVVLAGKFYRTNTGFLRHPQCHCRHIPASENIAGDMTTNPNRYFDSLSKKQQDETFTPAGAEAIRMGADISQVVNSRRGMQVAQVYGHKTLVTTEATTARGLAGKSLGELGKVVGQRYRVSRTPRLMPESILAAAKNPEDAIRLLTRFGYIA